MVKDFDGIIAPEEGIVAGTSALGRTNSSLGLPGESVQVRQDDAVDDGVLTVLIVTHLVRLHMLVEQRLCLIGVLDCQRDRSHDQDTEHEELEVGTGAEGPCSVVLVRKVAD